MILQTRDREFLRVCYEHQFLLVDHLRETFFKGKSKQALYLRIQKLEKAGVLKKENILGHAQVLRLTEAGEKLTRSHVQLELPRQRALPLDTLTHDALVISVRLRLRELWDGTWVPEILLKQNEYPRIPDGVVAFPGGKQIAIEVENSLKGKSRFLSLMKIWGKHPNVGMVLYVTTTKSLYSNLKGYISEGPKKPIFALVSWDELRSGTPKAFSIHGEIDLFSRRSF